MSQKNTPERIKEGRFIRDLAFTIKPKGGMNRKEALAYSIMLHAACYLELNGECWRFYNHPTSEFFSLRSKLDH